MKESLPQDELPSSEESNSEDEDDIPSDLEGPSEDEDEGSKAEGSDSFGDMLEDEDDLIPFDEDASQDEDEWGGLSESKKRKNNKETEGGRKKKRRLAGVPTFASYEDYAKMIDEAPEEDL